MKLTILSRSRRSGRLVGLAFVLAVFASISMEAAAQTVQPPLSSMGTDALDDTTIIHTLNRLTWGPRPGDVDAVRAIGLERWIEAQLHPERINDRVLERKLQAFETFGLSSADLLDGYNPPREVRQAVQRMRAERGEDATEAERRRAQRDLAMKYAPMMKGRPQQALSELQTIKVLRTIESERQLNELLVDFWFNHFNVYARKGPVLFLTATHERVIRKHAWGRFEDLLLETARSPAMLVYLDNWLSVDPDAARTMNARIERSMRRRGRRPPPGAGVRSGLNENYARELLELHTLGVDGGYTQQDVIEVARAFTGWTLRGLRERRPEFAFDSRVHSRGDKEVLGRTIRSRNEDEGREIIRMLARHPATARFVSWKLARRFVADEPPPALVERAARTWERTDGDIREVVRTIVTSHEFFGPESRAVKVKTPLEFVVSAVRAAGADVSDGRDLARRIGEMGMPLYLQPPPTGYKDTAEAWVSTNGLVSRLNFALDLAGGMVRGVEPDRTPLVAAAHPGARVTEILAAWLVPSGLSEATQEAIDAEVAAGLTPTRAAGLILGSPEFQRR